MRDHLLDRRFVLFQRSYLRHFAIVCCSRQSLAIIGTILRAVSASGTAGLTPILDRRERAVPDMDMTITGWQRRFENISRHKFGRRSPRAYAPFLLHIRYDGFPTCVYRSVFFTYFAIYKSIVNTFVRKGLLVRPWQDLFEMMNKPVSTGGERVSRAHYRCAIQTTRTRIAVKFN